MDAEEIPAVPPRIKSHRFSDAVETAATSKSGDEQGPKKSPSVEDRVSRASGALSDSLCPFATFTEWASEADEAAYSDL
ncbi:hypothetical protein [Methylocystis sp. SB2]|uniref:hypothetical protein n=1 Tax=Methylocystis sp. (strain SB2) TaxID=743836 RepID=UPI000404ABCE|nr:hypothetical protein [Methylocystis sp. SB2]